MMLRVAACLVGINLCMACGDDSDPIDAGSIEDAAIDAGAIDADTDASAIDAGSDATAVDAAPVDATVADASSCASHADCDDGDACNGAEQCDDAEHVCNSGSQLRCDPPDACHTASCDSAAGCVSLLIDGDDDGAAAASLGACGTDCDDGDDAVSPADVEVAGDAGDADEDCDGTVVCHVDGDDDGYRTAATATSSDLDCSDVGEGRALDPTGDCDDTNPGASPSDSEVPGDAGNVDENCDGAITCFADADSDGYRTSMTITSADLDCSDTGEATAADPAGDCNELAPAIHPGATEIAGDAGDLDEDCDGAIACFVDADTDGYRTTATLSSADADCADAGEARAALPDGDCNDGEAGISPGDAEVCFNTIDENCSETLDDNPECFVTCNWSGEARWLSHGLDGASYTATGGWFSCIAGRLSNVQWVAGGGTGVSPSPMGTADTLVGCNWSGSRWASQGVDGAAAFASGSTVACNGTRVTGMSFESNTVPAAAAVAGSLGCNWTGATFFSHGFDGGCAFQTGFNITCNAGRITHVQWVENAGCPRARD